MTIDWTLLGIGAVIGMLMEWRWRGITLVLFFGLPMMLLGYLFGYMQAGFITGYMLYRKYGVTKK